MQIPDYFCVKAARTFGEAGVEWLQSLPATLSRCQNDWHLTDVAPFDDLSINLVCTASSAVHGDVILKIAGPHDERITEMTALRLYGGRHACQCYECDQQTGAMLLERILPGHTLRALPDKRDQLEVGADLLATLPIPIHEDHGLPLYGDWISRAIAITKTRYAPGPRLIRLMSAAESLYRQVCPNDAPRALLHGDLHHENMLQCADGQWKAIDPQGVIGAPFFDSARFIENHAIGRDEVLSVDTLDESVTLIRERLGVGRHLIGAATFVLHLLSTCWGLQMSYGHQRILKQISECEQMLEYTTSS